jgi:CBS domain-containing protein
MSFIAKDYMSKKIKSVRPDMNAKKALQLLIKSKTSGLPVIDRTGAVVGVFTEKEVLKAILPSYIKYVGAFIYGEDTKSELKKLCRLEKCTVKDVMRTEVPTISPETSLTEVSKIMLTRSERRVIVTKGKKAIGVITRSDVVKALAKEAGMRF